MNWLDSGKGWPCNATEGDPSIIRLVMKDPAVTFSFIKWERLGVPMTRSEKSSKI
jgi:cellulase